MQRDLTMGFGIKSQRRNEKYELRNFTDIRSFITISNTITQIGFRRFQQCQHSQLPCPSALYDSNALQIRHMCIGTCEISITQLLFVVKFVEVYINT